MRWYFLALFVIVCLVGAASTIMFFMPARLELRSEFLTKKLLGQQSFQLGLELADDDRALIGRQQSLRPVRGEDKILFDNDELQFETVLSRTHGDLRAGVQKFWTIRNSEFGVDDVACGGWCEYVLTTRTQADVILKNRKVVLAGKAASYDFLVYDGEQALCDESRINDSYVDPLVRGVHTILERADCRFSAWTDGQYNYFNITFHSDGFFDPVITLNNPNNITEQIPKYYHLEVSDEAPYDSIFFYWSGDFDTNLTAYDLTNTTVFSNITGVPDSEELGECPYDNCYNFSGNGNDVEYVQFDFDDVDSYFEPFPVFQNYTISAWARSERAQTGSFFSLGDITGNGNQITLERDSGGNAEFTFAGVGGSVVAESSDVDMSDMNHYVGVVNGTNVSLWINGELKAVVPRGNARPQTGAGTWKVRIGTNAIGSVGAFSGDVDDAMIFSEALNDSQIQEIYNNQSKRFRPSGNAFTSTSFTVGQDGTINRMNITVSSEQFLDSSVQSSILGWNNTAYNDSFTGDDEDVAKRDGIILWYHLDNNADFDNATNVYDFSGNDRNGTYSDLTEVVGYYEDAFNFSNSEDGINASSTPIENLSELTVSVWTRHRNGDPGAEMILGSFNNSHIPLVFYYSLPGIYELNVFNKSGSSVSAAISPAITDTDWHNFIFVFNGTEVTAGLLDGVDELVNAGVITGLIGRGEAYNEIFHVGGGNFGGIVDPYNGTIDEVMVWNRTLTTDEMTSIYERGRLLFSEADNSQSIPEGNFVNVSFNITTDTHHVLVEFNLTADQYDVPFYTPILIPNITTAFYADAEPDPAPTVTLISPQNGSTVSSEQVWFFADISDNSNATNATLWLWNETALINNTQVGVVGNMSGSVNLSVMLPEQDQQTLYVWNYFAYDNSTTLGFAAANFTFTYTFVPEQPSTNVRIIPFENNSVPHTSLGLDKEFDRIPVTRLGQKEVFP